MGRLAALIVVLLGAITQAQGAKDDDLSSAFGPQPAAKKFEPEHNVAAPPLPDDPNAPLRATFEQDLAAAQKTLDAGDAAAAREQTVMLEVSAMGLGGPERVRVHHLQRAAAAKLSDRKALKEADEKWLAACGPNDVAPCRASALEAIAVYDPQRADKVRAADACLMAAEAKPGKPPPACLDSAGALYQKSDDSLMIARVELARALALASEVKQSSAAKKALARLAASNDDRVGAVRRTALETQSRLELAQGATEAAVKDAILASEAWASTLPPARHPWARSPMLDVACAAYEKTKGAGACRKLEKRVAGGYLFHDFSVAQLGEQLISHDKLVEVNEHYGVLIQNCLAAEILTLDRTATISYRVRWLVISDGRVDNFHSESTLQDESHFVQCLREQFGYWRYPRHEGDPQRIEQSFFLRSSSKTWEESPP